MSKATPVNDATFAAEVLSSEIPVLVDFGADWCMPCRIIEPVVSDIADEYAGRAKVFSLDVDSAPSIAAKYGIRGVPSLLFFKGGQEVGRIVGVQPKAEITRVLDALLGAPV